MSTLSQPEPDDPKPGLAAPDEAEPDDPGPGLVPPDLADPLAMAQWLGATMGRLTKQLKDATEASEDRDEKLEDYGRGNRHRIWLSYVLIFIDVALTVVVIVFASQASDASTRANSATSTAAAADARAAALAAAEQAQHAAQVSGCVSGNQYRVGVVASLDRLVIILEGSNPTPAVKKAALSYEQYVLSKNEPRDCQTAYPLKPQPKETGGGG